MTFARNLYYYCDKSLIPLYYTLSIGLYLVVQTIVTRIACGLPCLCQGNSYTQNLMSRLYLGTLLTIFYS